MKDELSEKGVGNSDEIALLKHDIRNQLSNINLAIEQLRYELPDNASADSLFYLETIINSCQTINVLLKDKA